MRGGTYAEALKVGFTEDQAGMLGRLSVETTSEAVNYCDELIERKRIAIRYFMIRYFMMSVAMIFVGIAIGVSI